MNRIQRIVLAALAALCFLATMSPALAGGGDHAEGDTAEVTDTTQAIMPVDGDVPAVIVPPAEEKEAEQPWTARYIIPLLTVTAALTIVGTIIMYNRSVRRRYHVVA